eukprot:scaffold11169_cov72-Phaeocystis_antarctica.AAC.3
MRREEVVASARLRVRQRGLKRVFERGFRVRVATCRPTADHFQSWRRLSQSRVNIRCPWKGQLGFLPLRAADAGHKFAQIAGGEVAVRS